MIQPLVWLAVAALALHGWVRLQDRPPLSKVLIGIAFLVGLFHVSILLIAGVVWDFGDSPMAGRLINYPKNLLYVTTLLAGLESARAYLFQAWRRFGEQWAFALVTALLFVVVIPAGQWGVLDGFDQFTRFVGGRWVPALALSVLATYLVRYGGIGPSFAYMFALMGFERFSPILPSLDWSVLLIIGVVVPLASASLVRSIYEETAEGEARLEAETGGAARTEDEEPRTALWKQALGWVGTLALVAVAALFLLGAFGFRMLVIEGISMEPAYERGDLAIVRENIDLYLLEEDDVIVFEQDGFPIVHRIIEITDDGDGLVFTTQGDNVGRPDPPIRGEQVQGKVVFLIPEIGHVNLWLRGG
jgi:signal peptidase